MHSFKLFWLSPLFLFASCANGTSEKQYNNGVPVPASIAKADSSTPVAEGASLTAPGRKIIYTADFHCKVADVFKATSRLEQMTKAVGGIVQESHMDNVSDEVKTVYYKADSMRQIQNYTTTALLTLRVPVIYVDSIINSIPGLAAFIDSRTLKQNDVTWTYLSNELKNQTNVGAADAASYTPKHTNTQLATKEYDDNKQEQIINRKIINLQMTDDVTYATITVALAQPTQVYTQIIANKEHLTRVPFLLQCESALTNGWDFIGSVIVILIDLWPLLFFLAIGGIVYKKLKNRPVTAASK